MSSHFRGADNPNWAFTKETEKLINQQEKKMKLTSKVKGIWKNGWHECFFRKRQISHKIYVQD